MKLFLIGVHIGLSFMFLGFRVRVFGLGLRENGTEHQQYYVFTGRTCSSFGFQSNYLAFRFGFAVLSYLGLRGIKLFQSIIQNKIWAIFRQMKSLFWAKF